jgi:phospholipid/cholesterol/gamma-HCH transport system ATP-binding protein
MDKQTNIVETQKGTAAVAAEASGELTARVVDLKKSFDDNHVLNGVSFEIKKGENLVVMGKSGSGKSVLIKCMVRLLQHDSGTLEVLGKEVDKLTEKELNDLRLKIGFLFQSGALYDSMTVRENLEFALRQSDIKDKSEIDKLVEEALTNVELSEAIDKMPSELSGGMRKRAGLARTIIMKPELIMYDEPSTGLDPITARGISELIVEIQKKYQTSSIIITHDIECAEITANRIIMLREGKVEAEGTFEELKKSEDEWIHSFFNRK